MRRGAGKLWLLADNGLLWRGESDGFHAVAGSPVLQRIAVDSATDPLRSGRSTRTTSVRRYRQGVWHSSPGPGLGRDVAAHAGQAWVVGMNGVAHHAAAPDAAFQPIPQNPALLKRITVDRSKGTLWALSVEGRIYSRVPGAIVWIEHPGNGRGNEVVAHDGVAYVIGAGDRLYRSQGAAGWQAMTVVQPRG